MADSLHRLALACLLPGFEGTTAPDWLRRRVAEGLGGVVLFARNVASPGQLARLGAGLRAERPTVLVAIDEEGGDVTRLEAARGSSYPGNLALGVAGDPALTRAVGLAIGADLRGASVNLDLAPVADLNSDPRNPVVGVRSFGGDPVLVARHVRAAVQGIQTAGVAACAKHFPGHGDTAVDSHLGLPTVGDELTGALLPFRAAVDAGVRAVMTGHLLVPGYGSLPATLNPALIDGLLRAELGYRGAVISDGIEMAAVAATFGLAEATVLALLAGVDAICVGGGLAGEQTALRLRAALVDAVLAGRLPEQRLVEAAGRVADLARWTTGTGGPGPDRAGAAVSGTVAGTSTVSAAGGPGRASAGGPGGDLAGGESADAAAARVGLAAARRALRVEGHVRLPAGVAPMLIELDPAPSLAVGRTGWGLSTVLPERVPGSTVRRIGPDDALAPPAVDRPLVVVTRDAARVRWQRAALDRLLAARPDAVVVEMGLGGPPPAARYVQTFSASRASAVAAVDVLLGPAR